jgi:bacterioferritin-associated ferredoxin
MHVCSCNNFNDAKVREVVTDHPEAKKVRDIYSICANKQKPNCGKCLLTVKEIMEEVRPSPAAKARPACSGACAP